MEHKEVRALIGELFEEAALLIGGLIATYDVEDEFIWRLMRNLDLLRQRIFECLEAEEPKTPPAPPNRASPHPAVQHFLSQLRHGEKPAREPRP
ncbi:hypothetical protein HY251_00140 [bacterium]|nr:hypothetical protein [bacterium]